MRKWLVTLTTSIEVEAEDEDDANEAALDVFHEDSRAFSMDTFAEDIGEAEDYEEENFPNPDAITDIRWWF